MAQTSTSTLWMPTRRAPDRARTPSATATCCSASAAELFTANGVDYPLEDIAREAGVGIGTLYRHFPTRSALIEAVYRREVAQLCDSVDDLLATVGPDEALEAWMHNFVEYVATKRGLSAALRDMMGAEPDLFARPVRASARRRRRCSRRGRQAGAIRPVIDGDDLVRAMGAICMATDDAGYRTAPPRPSCPCCSTAYATVPAVPPDQPSRERHRHA